MDYAKILKRAFSITLNYRVLWVFGIILALTTGGRGPNLNTGYRGNGDFALPGKGYFPSPDRFKLPEIASQTWNNWIPIAIAIGCLILLIGILFAIGRYVSEVAAIRMVNDYESTGEKVTVRQGFQLGWTRSAWRLFLVDLLVGVGVAIVFLLLLIIVLTPLLVWLTDSIAVRVMGTAITIGLFILFILIGIASAIVITITILIVRRVCVLENLGVIESIRQGYAMARRHPGDLLVMGIIMFGLGLAWVIVMIPVFILLIIAGVIIGGIPALLAGGIASLFAKGTTPWIIAAVIGVPSFMLVLAAPALFLNGLKEVFKSSTWTLVYRELQTLDRLAQDTSQPELSPVSDETSKELESDAEAKENHPPS
jgi:hypothetical protein